MLIGRAPLKTRKKYLRRSRGRAQQRNCRVDSYVSMDTMTEKELWAYLLDARVAFAHPLDRDFIWVSTKDFQEIKRYFIKEVNVFHSGDSFRSLGYIHHIHAVRQGDVVFTHRDTGNMARFLPLGLVHLVVDVIPYIWYSWIRRVPLSSVFKCPIEQ